MQLTDPAVLGATLRDLFRTDGGRLLDETPYLRARLSDRVPQSVREIPLLVAAQSAGVPKTLYYSPRTFSLRSSLIAKLKDDCGLSMEAATWCVGCWAFALDVTFLPDARPIPLPHSPAPGPQPDAYSNSKNFRRGGVSRPLSPAEAMTPGAFQAGGQRIQEQNRQLTDSQPQMIRRLATVAVIIDAAYTLILTLSRVPSDFPGPAVAAMFVISAAVVTLAVLMNSSKGKIFARILLVGSGIMLFGDVVTLATSPGVANAFGMLLDGLAFYMCFRVGFERTVPARPQQVNVYMGPQ